jgi:hypothetical protein
MNKFMLVFVLGMFAIATYAQEVAAPKKTVEERAAQFGKALGKELGLSADQTMKIEAVQLDALKKVDAIRAKGMEGDRKAMRQEMKAVYDAADAQIKEFLSDDQKVKFAAWQEKKKEEMKNRQGPKGGENNQR